MVQKKTLKGISDIRRFFHRNETPIFFISATNFNLLGMDEWCKNFKFISYIDCYDGRHPNTFVPNEAPHPQFNSIETSTTTCCSTRRCSTMSGRTPAGGEGEHGGAPGFHLRDVDAAEEGAVHAPEQYQIGAAVDHRDVHLPALLRRFGLAGIGHRRRRRQIDGIGRAGRDQRREHAPVSALPLIAMGDLPWLSVDAERYRAFAAG